jgi:hypothetical protein
MATSIIVLRHQGPWPVPAAQVLSGVPAPLTSLPREDIEVNTSVFTAQVDQGDWGGQARFLAERASEIHARLATASDTEVHYFGLAEIPHVIAMGAFIGDEVPVEIHEFDRDTKSWVWPSAKKALEARIIGLPEGAPIPAAGSVVLRVEISFAISDQDVHEAAGSKHLAEVRVALAEHLNPSICKVRSPADLQEIRMRVREAIAGIRTKFPNFETLHVFAAAPVSVCFALGQELKPRNSPPIQTYRFRKIEGQPAYAPALILSAALEGQAEAPLTEEDHAAAAAARHVWREALREVETYAATKEALKVRAPGKWFELLEPVEAMRAACPFPPLPAVCDLVPQGALVDDSPVATEYGFSKPDKTWHLSDRLLLALRGGTGGDPDKLKRLIRLFLFHEYLHDFHSLTKYRAAEVGRFQNCLEHIDYTADSYAIIHQLDLQASRDHTEVNSDQKRVEFVKRQVELVVGSFWAFQPAPPIREWQVRRLRRYLNWYWRLVQIGYAKDFLTVLRLLARPPHVEVVGLHQVAVGQRVFCHLDRIDHRTKPELGLVLENHKLLRVFDSVTSPLPQFLSAFQNRDHDAIVKFFLGVYEQANELGGALPTE